jgi:hypothetical protein
MHCLQGYSLSRARESSILGKLLTFILPFLLVGRAEGQFNLRGRFDQKVNAGGTNTITGSFDIYSKLSEVLPGADKYLFGYISGEKTGNPNIALFDYLGQRRVSTQLTTNKVIAFTVRSDYTIVLGSQLASPKREVWSISYVAFPTQYTMSKTSSVNPTIDAERADHDTTSTYVFFATVQKCDRLDTSTMALSTVATFSTANANTVLCSGCTSIIEVIVDEPKPYFAILPFDNKLAVMTRTSLTSIITYANGPALIEGACLDNLGSNIVFALLNNYGNSNKYAVATLDFTITDTTKLPVATFVNTPYSSSQVCSNNIVNVGPLAYIMFIPSLLDNGKIYIYGKTPLAFVSSTLSPASNLGYTTECFTVVGTQLVDDRYYFTTRAETGSLSVNSHYLSADFCNSRDASNICQVCAAGYVRSSLSPNNICILPSQITSGNGIDIPTNSVMACTSANCLKCTSDRTICNTCSTSPQAYLYNDACYTVATAPAGVGVNTTTTMATCTTTQCVSCAADNTVCLACNSAVSPRYYLQGNNCVLLSSVTGAFGATASGTIATCTVSGCTACLNDNTICTACTSGSTWLITNQCLAPASFPAGTGVTSPTTTGPCTSAGCKECGVTVSTCTVCNTGGGYYLYSGACYTTGTMPSGYGLSGTTVVACQSTGCTNCGALHCLRTHLLPLRLYLCFLPSRRLRHLRLHHRRLHSQQLSDLFSHHDLHGLQHGERATTSTTASNTCILQSAIPSGSGVNTASRHSGHLSVHRVHELPSELCGVHSVQHRKQLLPLWLCHAYLVTRASLLAVEPTLPQAQSRHAKHSTAPTARPTTSPALPAHPPTTSSALLVFPPLLPATASRAPPSSPAQSATARPVLPSRRARPATRGRSYYLNDSLEHVHPPVSHPFRQWSQHCSRHSGHLSVHQGAPTAKRTMRSHAQRATLEATTTFLAPHAHLSVEQSLLAVE